MSPFLELISPVTVLIAYALASALWGMSLLGRYLKRQPITRERLVYTAWNVAIMGLGIAVGSAINAAYERGMISVLATAILATILFAAFGGGSCLLDRRYPDQRASAV